MSKINQTTWIVALSTIDSGISNELAEPEFPGIVTITNPEGGEIINFTAGTEGTSPITSYVASVIPSGPTATVVSADLAVGGYVELSDFTYDVGYIVSISAVNEFGQGEAAYTNSFIIEDVYNEASGGTETIVYDYNGTGERWKVHTFLADETFEVTSSPNPFRVLVVAGGGACKYTINSGQGGGGGGGMLTNDAMALSATSHTITVGSGGVIGSTWPENGEDTTAFGLTSIGGGHGAFRDGGSQITPGVGGSGGGESRNAPYPGGAGTPGQGYNGGSGDSANPGGGGGANGVGVTGGNGPGKSSDIIGSTVTYARGGGSDGWDASQQYGAGGNFGGLAAQSGVVIVAYEISSAFNSASGGTEIVVDDYNGTGEQWKVHTFTSSGAFEVANNANPFKVLVVNGGNPGGGVVQGRSGNGGIGGTARTHDEQILSVGSLSVTVGAPGAGSSLDSVTAAGGSGGAGGAGKTHGGSPPGSGGGGGAGPTSNVSGSVVYYSGGGGGGGLDYLPSGGGNRGGGQGSGGATNQSTGSAGAANTGGGGGGQGFESSIGPYGGPHGGGTGIVMVAYQIGVSTIAQIKVAQTVRKAELRKQQLAEKALQKQQALEAKLRK